MTPKGLSSKFSRSHFPDRMPFISSRVLHRLASLEGGMKQSTRFLATHPLSSERVQVTISSHARRLEL